MSDPDREWTLFPPFDTCPGCGRVGELKITVAGDLVNFVCPACRTCWHPQLGWAHRVNPAECPGCEYRALCTSEPTEGTLTGLLAVADSI